MAAAGITAKALPVAVAAHMPPLSMLRSLLVPHTAIALALGVLVVSNNRQLTMASLGELHSSAGQVSAMLRVSSALSAAALVLVAAQAAYRRTVEGQSSSLAATVLAQPCSKLLVVARLAQAVRVSSVAIHSPSQWVVAVVVPVVVQSAAALPVQPVVQAVMVPVVLVAAQAVRLGPSKARPVRTVAVVAAVTARTHSLLARMVPVVLVATVRIWLAARLVLAAAAALLAAARLPRQQAPVVTAVNTAVVAAQAAT